MQGGNVKLGLLRFIPIALVVSLAACEPPEEILPGQRLDVRTPVSGSAAPTTDRTASFATARLGAPQNLGAWSHRGSGPTHRTPHLALDANLTPIWATSIGRGETRGLRIKSDPVSDGGRIFALDAGARVTAVSVNGSVLWSRDLTPANESDDDGSGGGVAISGNRLFVSTGFGSLHALDATSGGEIWAQDLDSVAAGPPTVRGGLVYLVSRDNQAWAIDAQNGRVRWRIPGLPAVAAFAGGASPAVSEQVAVFPFSTGEMVAVLRRGGIRLWSGTVSGQRLGQVYAVVRDFGSDPVISGNRVYAGTQSGRTVAMDLTTGRRLWTAATGTIGPVLAQGNSIWMISDLGQLTRVNAASGEIVWERQLPLFEDQRARRRKGIVAHHGPILAGGRLVVASSDGLIRSFDPNSGALLGTVPLPTGAASSPIVVNRTLYVLTRNGQLRAFR